MISAASLHGKKVLIPRESHYAKSFSELIRSYGGFPVEIPLLAFRPIQSIEAQPYFQSLHTYDWLIFTSNVTVETFFSFLKNKMIGNSPKIAVIGEKTEQELVRRGLAVHFKPMEYVAEGFVRDFLPIVNKGERVLIPKGNLGREYIAKSLRENGVNVDEMTIYETYFPKESKEKLLQSLRAHELQILPFTSPSTVDHLMSIVNEYSLQDSIDDCIVACIGPTTKERAESLGLKVNVMPDIYTVHEMVLGIVSYLNKDYLHNL